MREPKNRLYDSSGLFSICNLLVGTDAEQTLNEITLLDPLSRTVVDALLRGVLEFNDLKAKIKFDTCNTRPNRRKTLSTPRKQEN
jgi:hypothetical protein